jgi:hypothetical protein
MAPCTHPASASIDDHYRRPRRTPARPHRKRPRSWVAATVRGCGVPTRDAQSRSPPARLRPVDRLRSG